MASKTVAGNSYLTSLDFANVHAASYKSYFVMGLLGSDDTYQESFIKSVRINSKSYIPLCRAIDKALDSFKNNDNQPWEMDLSKVTTRSRNKLAAVYSSYADQFNLHIRSYWQWRNDQSFLLDVAEKRKTAPSDDKLWLPTRGGVHFSEGDLEKFVLEKLQLLMLNSALDQHFIEHVRDFITYIWQVDEEKLKNWAESEEAITPVQQQKLVSSHLTDFCRRQEIDLQGSLYKNLLDGFLSHQTTLFALIFCHYLKEKYFYKD